MKNLQTINEQNKITQKEIFFGHKFISSENYLKKESVKRMYFFMQIPFVSTCISAHLKF